MDGGNITEDSQLMSLREFLETMPASELRRTKTPGKFSDQKQFVIVMPEILLFCGSETCKGSRLHHVKVGYERIQSGGLHFSPYICKSCGGVNKTYALSFGKYSFNEAQDEVDVVKIGEYPAFEHYAPIRTLHLVQPNADLFKKALRAESLGHGMGAFAYYRQIVELQHAHFLKEIKQVAARSGASLETLRAYDEAIEEDDLGKSVHRLENAIPQSLLINSYSPLLLLQSAIAQGLPATTDRECLEISGSIRVILTELANRISDALKDEQELTQAINRLMPRKAA